MKPFHFTYSHWLFLLILLCVPALQGNAEEMDPMPHPEAVVTAGNVRFTVLTDRMIRIQYSATAQFEDRATFAIVNRKLPVPHFTTQYDDTYLYIHTDSIDLRYKLGSVPKESDKNPNNLLITFQMNGFTCKWYPGKDDALNLLGTHRTLDTAWGDNMRDRLEKGLVSRAGWAIIDESPKTTREDGSTSYALKPNKEGFMWWEYPIDPDATDWYFLGYGHNYKQCISDYIKVGGRIPLPPKYIFGYWYSRYAAYSTDDFKQIIRDVEKYSVPMDVLIMDMDWHKDGWTGWSWNTNLIPNPQELITYMHQHRIRTALNLHPADGVASHEDYYDEMKKELGYPDNYTATLPWAVEDYDYMKAIFKCFLRKYEQMGVDFWWLDWQQHLLVNNMTLGETFWCNHTFFEDMRTNRPELRPVIYHRWGGLGSHRYPIGFSGDTFSKWTTLGYLAYFTSNASNVCYTYWGHDIGGHQGGRNDQELYLRWLQFGVYTPIFRTHALKSDDIERRIWKYPNFVQLREAVRLRYRLFPYLYTAARETYDTGIGMNRPLYYEWPEEGKAYQFEDEFMFGNDILVAPIYEPAQGGISTRNIWLPKGLWWDVTQNSLAQGDRTFRGEFTLDQFPVYYKAGSIIPFYPIQRTVVYNPSTITLYVVPGADGSGSLYEDDGANNAYTGDEWARTTFTQKRTAEEISLTIHGRQGTFEGIPVKRTWAIEMPATPENCNLQGITVNGDPVDASLISYNSTSKLLKISITAEDLGTALTLRVPISPAEGEQAEADGNAQINYDSNQEAVHITTPQKATSIRLTISTIGGACVANGEAQEASSLHLSLATLPTGTYICRAIVDGKTTVRKIIKK